MVVNQRSRSNVFLIKDSCVFPRNLATNQSRLTHSEGTVLKVVRFMAKLLKEPKCISIAQLLLLPGPDWPFDEGSIRRQNISKLYMVRSLNKFSGILEVQYFAMESTTKSLLWIILQPSLFLLITLAKNSWGQLNHLVKSKNNKKNDQIWCHKLSLHPRFVACVVCISNTKVAVLSCDTHSEEERSKASLKTVHRQMAVRW